MDGFSAIDPSGGHAGQQEIIWFPYFGPLTLRQSALFAQTGLEMNVVTGDIREGDRNNLRARLLAIMRDDRFLPYFG